jgi:hypothetical protein
MKSLQTDVALVLSLQTVKALTIGEFLDRYETLISFGSRSVANDLQFSTVLLLLSE